MRFCKGPCGLLTAAEDMMEDGICYACHLAKSGCGPSHHVVTSAATVGSLDGIDLTRLDSPVSHLPPPWPVNFIEWEKFFIRLEEKIDRLEEKLDKLIDRISSDCRGAV